MMKLKQKLKEFLKRCPLLYNMAIFLYQKRNYPKDYKIRTQKIIRGGGILFPEPGKRVYSERNEDWLVSYVQKTGDYAYLKLDDGTGYLKYSLSNEEKDLASAISCDERLKNLFQYLSLCGVRKLHISMLSREDYKKIQSAWGELAAEFGIRIVKRNGDIRIAAYTFVYLVDNISSSSFADLLINAVECLAKHYSDIMVVDDSPMAKRLMDDFHQIGKSFFAVEKGVIKNAQGQIRLNERHEVCITTDVRSTSFFVRGKNKEKIFHLPFVSLFLSDQLIYQLGYHYEEDIALNIIPNMQKKGILPIIIQYPLDNKEIGSRYNTIPASLWDAFHNRDIIDSWWDGIDLEEYKTHISTVARSGCMYFCDQKSKSYTRICGERITHGSTYDEKPDIFMSGPCTIEGVTSVDEKTISSIMQSYSQDYHFHNICVPQSWQPIRLRELKAKENDLVCILVRETELFRNTGVPIISVAQAYLTDYEEREKLRWDNALHVNGTMNKYLAETIYEQIKPYIKEGGSQKKTRMCCSGNADYDFKALWFKYHKGLTEWYDSVKDALVPADKAGAIVMNCNPFTKGHEYLIETARKQVDVLYIFVVEEDKSVFPFAQRFEMVKRTTAEMANVVVLPSGNFMISADTLPDYFAKEQLQEQIIDPSYDVILFAEAIAPSLGISVRFAGEEPEDKVTAQYNDWMARLLPEYGIEFKTFRRKESGGSPISGTKVRSLYEENRWEDMRELVPGVVVDYLKECKESS